MIAAHFFFSFVNFSLFTLKAYEILVQGSYTFILSFSIKIFFAPSFSFPLFLYDFQGVFIGFQARILIKV
jgi:hypothetical protein